MPLPLTLAIRELRAGLKGFYIFILCIALGVAAIAGVQSLSKTLTSNLIDQSAAILGGNAEIMLVHRETNTQEYEWIKSKGDMSAVVTMRAMARVEKDDTQTLVEIKGVDNAYPLIGDFESQSERNLSELLKRTNDGDIPAIVANSFMEQLSLDIGDSFKLGNAYYQVVDIIKKEPDQLSGGLGFGPRVMLSIDGLRQSGLIQQGTLMNWRYRIKSASLDQPNAINLLREEASEKFPQAGWRIRGMDAASPGFASNIERFAQFLTLIGITALLVGGVGIANAVRTFVDSKKYSIATLKSIGAKQSLIYKIYFWQILMIALIGIIIGLIFGALIPIIGLEIISLFLPLGGDIRLFPSALMMGAIFGLLTTFTFGLTPLAQTEKVPVTALFRGYTNNKTALPRKRYIFLSFLSAALLIYLAITTSYDPTIASWFILGSIVVIGLLWLFGSLIMKVIASLPSPRNIIRKIAFNNIHRPDALTPHVTLSLGLGLTLLVTISLIDRTITNQMLARVPDQIPSFFFIGIQNNEKAQFDRFIQDNAKTAQQDDAPMLRGRILKINDIPASEYQVQEGAEWVLRGDRGITFSSTPPASGTLVAGEWWDENHAGENLVSFKAEEGAELGLDIGDTITVNVLGRNVTAKIANFREQEWESFSINFVMVFSPNTFKGAPYPWLSTLTFEDEPSPDQEAEILKEVTKQFPSVTPVPVKQVLETATGLIGQITWGFRSASAVTIIAAILVLSGALAASHRHRLYDVVLLKTLGTTRLRVLTTFIIEYALLGFITALFAVLVGSLTSYLVTNRLMQMEFQFDWLIAIITALFSIILTVGLGLLSTYKVLKVKPAQQLKSL